MRHRLSQSIRLGLCWANAGTSSESQVGRQAAFTGSPLVNSDYLNSNGLLVDAHPHNVVGGALMNQQIAIVGGTHVAEDAGV